MIEKSSTQIVLNAFFERPSINFHLRELSRSLGMSMPTIISTTDTLAKEGLITKTKGKLLTTVVANRESAAFIRYKRLHNLESLYNSGLADYLEKIYNHPKIIVLFGSFSRGDDIETSDVDIAIDTTKKLNVSTSAYERILRRSISIHEINFVKVSKEFKANLMNGIVLEGSW